MLVVIAVGTILEDRGRPVRRARRYVPKVVAGVGSEIHQLSSGCQTEGRIRRRHRAEGSVPAARRRTPLSRLPDEWGRA